MKFGDIIIYLIIFVAGSLIISFLVYPNSFQSFKSNIKSIIPSTGKVIEGGSRLSNSYTSIQDLNQNPSNYLNKEITIRGKLNNRLGGYSLEDSGGYWVWIGVGYSGEGCIEKQREYNFNSQVYTAKGIWKEGCKGGFMAGCTMGFEANNRLECSSPIN